MSKYTLYDYDSSKFPFKETVQSMMDVDQLDMIHEVFEFPEKLEIIKDQNTILHDKFYEEMKKAEFTNLYRGSKLDNIWIRCLSRLSEMQTKQYFVK